MTSRAQARHGPEAVPPSGRLVVRRFLPQKLAVTGLVVLAALFAAAYLGPLLSPWSVTDQDPTAYLQPPSGAHWFGTTAIGEDVFTRTMSGLQKSLLIGVLVALVATTLAAVFGTTAGYFGGWVDRSLMWVVDLLLILPALLVIAILTPAVEGWLVLVPLLAAFFWMVSARMVRGVALTLREREYVQAARFAGVPAPRIISGHVVPNMASLLIIDGTVTVGHAVLAEAGLSFLGFGVQPPDVSLGTLIASGSRSASAFPWLFLFAGGLLLLTVLAVNLVGEGLRDALDPHSRPARPRRPPPAVPSPSVRDPAPPASQTEVLAVTGLRVWFPVEQGWAPAVRGLSFEVAAGEVLGVVGESGGGKSASALAVMGLLPPSAAVRGSVRFRGRELLGCSDRELSGLRGRRIAMIFQDARSALTPVHRVRDQVAEALRIRGEGRTASTRAVELLDLVGIPADRASCYPHELSGGMCQRVLIAMAVAGEPDLIIADEPTSGLDVTVAAQILDVLALARDVTGAAVVLITHDLGMVAGVADRVLVMYGGRTVEAGRTVDVLGRPRMPYTVGLLGSLPRMDGPRMDGGARRPLVPISGRPTSPLDLPPGCAFATRCPISVAACHE